MMEEFKSFRQSKHGLLLTFFVTITRIIYTSGFAPNIKDDLEDKKIIADLPVTNDFPTYFMALRRAIDFCVNHKYYVDYNLQFGLFLTDMALLYYNTWPEPPVAFNTKMLNQTRILSQAELAIIYDTWENYHYNVYNDEDNRPTAAEADECIALLVQNDLTIRSSQPSCLMGPRCKRVMLGENEFGYGLTHRLLLMAIARFSEKCVVFSEKTDKIKTDMFCKKCYNEADFIAYNNFHLPDLMFEQISLCGLFGHVQFIRKHWLKTLLGFQTSVGCFSEKLATGDFQENWLKEDADKEWYIERPSDIIYGQCNAHFSAVAMATLSHALRYIIETYY